MTFKPIQYRAHNGYDQKAASDDAVVYQDPVSLTVQSQAEEADINVLMRRYGITGKMPENPKIPTYGDFTGITDYRSALDAIRNAQEGFSELTADVRGYFQNDPQALLEFMDNPANRPQAEKLGLLKPPQPPIAPPPATPVAAPPQGEPKGPG